MAAKFGKREKIIVGVIIGIAAIIGIHIQFFASAANDDSSLKAKYNEVNTTFTEMDGMPKGPALDKYLKEVAADEDILLNTVFHIDILTTQPWISIPKPLKPVAAIDGMPASYPRDTSSDLAADTSAAPAADPFATDDGGGDPYGDGGGMPEGPAADPLTEATFSDAEFNIKIKKYQKDLERNFVMAEAIIADQLERFILMKEAYETGQPWQGDSAATASTTTGTASANAPGTVQLPFLYSDTPNQLSWNIPLQLDINDDQALWAAVGEMSVSAESLKLMIYGVPQYFEEQAVYRASVKAIGLDINNAPNIKIEFGLLLPEFAKVILARQIWRRRPPPPNQDVTINDVTMTYTFLKEWLLVNFEPDDPSDAISFGPDGTAASYSAGADGAPPPSKDPIRDLYALHRQLTHLEKLIVMARAHGIDSIDRVSFPKPYTIYNYQAADVATAKAKLASLKSGASRASSAARPGRPLTLGDSSSPGGNPYSMDSMGQTTVELYLTSRVAAGFATVVEISFTADYAKGINYLDAILKSPEFFRLEGMTISATTDADKVQFTQMQIAAVGAIKGLSGPKDGVLADPVTGAVKNFLGAEPPAAAAKIAAKVADEKKRGIDRRALVEKALIDANMPLRIIVATPEALADDTGADTGEEPAI